MIIKEMKKKTHLSIWVSNICRGYLGLNPFRHKYTKIHDQLLLNISVSYGPLIESDTRPSAGLPKAAIKYNKIQINCKQIATYLIQQKDIIPMTYLQFNCNIFYKKSSLKH